MECLRQSELRSLLDFVRGCYTVPQSANFDDFANWLVGALPRLIPCAHATYNEMDPWASESVNYVNTPEPSSSTAGELWEHHMHEHPVLHYVLETEDRGAMRISDLWSRSQLRNSGLHHDFYRHYGISDALCITVPCAPPRLLGVGWHDDRVFTDREKLIADLVRPHISQACHNAVLFSQAQNRTQLFREAMGNGKTGVIECAADGAVQFINDHARGYLFRYFATSRQTDRCLPENLLLWMRRQDAHLSGDDAPPMRRPLLCDLGSQRLVIRMLSRAGMHLLMMKEQQIGHGRSGSAPARLTRRETEVLEWIAHGKTNAEIATILKIYVGTVKKHVEHIFTKLSVETRTAAALALRSARSQ